MPTPKGTRDFSPEVLAGRYFIIDTLRSVFQLFGFVPLETPSMENLSTLTGKYGDEGDQLLFKVLNSGDFLKKANQEAMHEGNSKALTPSISEKGLRYDLTIPFARFVAENRNLYMPFKRFQIQPVWRADRPQKGRYREFYQCDADIVGSSAIQNELDLVKLYQTAFNKLKLNVEIQVNDRRILEALAIKFNVQEHFVDMTVSLDKLDKIGPEKVIQEMVDKGIPESSAQGITDLVSTSARDFLAIKEILSEIESAEQPLSEIEYLLSNAFQNNEGSLVFDLSLARGLSYYTGAIFEVKSTETEMGSIGGGGRYSDLTGLFGLPDVSGVGVSFGLDRIYDVLYQLNRLPDSNSIGPKAVIASFSPNELQYANQVADLLRANNFSCEVYPEFVKLKKIFKYADEKSAEYLMLIGEEELTKQIVTVKHLESGKQESVQLTELANYL